MCELSCLFHFKLKCDEASFHLLDLYLPKTRHYNSTYWRRMTENPFSAVVERGFQAFFFSEHATNSILVVHF